MAFQIDLNENTTTARTQQTITLKFLLQLKCLSLWRKRRATSYVFYDGLKRMVRMRYTKRTNGKRQTKRWSDRKSASDSILSANDRAKERGESSCSLAAWLCVAWLLWFMAYRLMAWCICVLWNVVVIGMRMGQKWREVGRGINQILVGWIRNTIDSIFSSYAIRERIKDLILVRLFTLRPLKISAFHSKCIMPSRSGLKTEFIAIDSTYVTLCPTQTSASLLCEEWRRLQQNSTYRNVWDISKRLHSLRSQRVPGHEHKAPRRNYYI